MAKPFSAVADLSDQELLAEVKIAADRERAATSRLITLLAQLDERRLYLGEGCSSLFTYCTQMLHLSEHAAYGRIEAARAARRFPVILELLTDGSMTLTAVSLLAPHLTADNHREVLDEARHKSKREVEHIVARLRPQPAVPATVRKLPGPMASHASVGPRAVQPRAHDDADLVLAPAPAPRPPIVTPLAPGPSGEARGTPVPGGRERVAPLLLSAVAPAFPGHGAAGRVPELPPDVRRDVRMIAKPAIDDGRETAIAPWRIDPPDTTRPTAAASASAGAARRRVMRMMRRSGRSPTYARGCWIHLCSQASLSGRRWTPAPRGRPQMTRNMLLRLELLIFLALASAGCQVVEGIFKAGMWVGILLVVVVLGIIFMLFGRSRS